MGWRNWLKSRWVGETDYSGKGKNFSAHSSPDPAQSFQFCPHHCYPQSGPILLPAYPATCWVLQGSGEDFLSWEFSGILCIESGRQCFLWTGNAGAQFVFNLFNVFSPRKLSNLSLKESGEFVSAKNHGPSSATKADRLMKEYCTGEKYCDAKV